ncbi:MAG: ABC transporter ATP-binding protein [Aristaeellaceae bacterium]
MEPTLRVEHLTKRYGARTALSDVSFEAKRGEVIALLGPNGAGKSTLMNMLTGYIAMTEGKAAVCGWDVQRQPMQARRQVGYLPEQPPLYPDMTVTEYLRYCTCLKGIRPSARRAEIDRVIQCTGLETYARRLIGRLSKGYRQRLGVAQALLGTPKLLILDEPGSGLDPLQMTQMRDVIRNAGQESTVLLSSHMLSEVTNVCQRALVLHQGTLRYDGEMAQLMQGSGCVRIVWRGAPEAMDALRALRGAKAVRELPAEAGCRCAEIVPEPCCDLRGEVYHIMVEAGGELLELSRQQEGLEQAFLHLLSKGEEA